MMGATYGGPSIKNNTISPCVRNQVSLAERRQRRLGGGGSCAHFPMDDKDPERLPGSWHTADTIEDLERPEKSAGAMRKKWECVFACATSDVEDVDYDGGRGTDSRPTKTLRPWPLSICVSQ